MEGLERQGKESGCFTAGGVHQAQLHRLGNWFPVSGFTSESASTLKAHDGLHYWQDPKKVLVISEYEFSSYISR